MLIGQELSLLTVFNPKIIQHALGGGITGLEISRRFFRCSVAHFRAALAKVSAFWKFLGGEFLGCAGLLDSEHVFCCGASTDFVPAKRRGIALPGLLPSAVL